MSSREEQPSERQHDGEARERNAGAAGERRRRLGLLGSAGAVAAVIVVALVLVSQGTGGQSPGQSAGTGGPTGVAETRAVFTGVPQDGTALGNPPAPMVLTEFVDLQCPFCRQAALSILPGLIDRYVRPGRLRLELRTLRFIGRDSDRGAKAAHAAATRDLMWNFAELWYRNQGQEGAGYATDGFIRGIARGAGVDPQLALDGIKAPALEIPVREAESQAKAAGVEGTPTFLLGPRPGRGKRINPPQLTFESFRQTLDRELSG